MQKRGFTLIELLIVIALIGVLAAVTISVMNPVTQQQKARDGRRKSDLEQIRTALEMYRADSNGIYPSGNGEAEGVLSTVLSDYLSNFPSDPGIYQYYYSGSSTTSTNYSLCAHLERETYSTACGINCGGTCTYQVNNP